MRVMLMIKGDPQPGATRPSTSSPTLVHRRDQDQSECVDGRRVQPPEAERRRGLNAAKDDPPQHGWTQQLLSSCGEGAAGWWLDGVRPSATPPT